ncbi:MAG: Lrp/AsnC family transcriptional regulator [Arenicellales bacterium]
MDRLDKRILSYLQADATLSTSELAERIGLSTTPCWRRVQKLENEGVIQKRVALLDRDKLNLGVDVFVAVKTNQHNSKWLDEFAHIVTEFDEVLEFYRMAGEIDYLIHVVVPDIPSFDRFYKKLINKIDINDVSSTFVMERIKYTTRLPLEYAG